MVNIVRAQFTWLKQPMNCDAETTSAAMKGAVTLAVTAIPRSAPVLAFGCVRIGHPMLI